MKKMFGIARLDSKDPNFKKKLAFELWSTQSSSDYRNDRERPYNGQPWTDEGERGKTEVKGITMRDLCDCFIMGVLSCAQDENYLKDDEFLKCWDFSECKSEEDKPKPTEYLLQKIKEGKYISAKVELGTWRPQDIYKIDLKNVDLMAAMQNMTCYVEKMMGIYPNLPASVSRAAAALKNGDTEIKDSL